MENIDTVESVILSMNTLEMFTRWPTSTVSHDNCCRPPGGILVRFVYVSQHVQLH